MYDCVLALLYMFGWCTTVFWLCFTYLFDVRLCSGFVSHICLMCDCGLALFYIFFWCTTVLWLCFTYLFDVRLRAGFVLHICLMYDCVLALFYIFCWCTTVFWLTCNKYTQFIWYWHFKKKFPNVKSFNLDENARKYLNYPLWCFCTKCFEEIILPTKYHVSVSFNASLLRLGMLVLLECRCSNIFRLWRRLVES